MDSAVKNTDTFVNYLITGGNLTENEPLHYENGALLLTNSNVCKIFNYYLSKDSDSNSVGIEGILHNFVFNNTSIIENESNIVAMLSQLPIEFHKNTGGGWTFLNACNNINGEQWTSFHLTMEKLFCLGMVLGKVKYLMPRNMWEMLPGSMPYLVIDLKGAK